MKFLFIGRSDLPRCFFSLLNGFCLHLSDAQLPESQFVCGGGGQVYDPSRNERTSSHNDDSCGSAIAEISDANVRPDQISPMCSKETA